MFKLIANKIIYAYLFIFLLLSILSLLWVRVDLYIITFSLVNVFIGVSYFIFLLILIKIGASKEDVKIKTLVLVFWYAVFGIILYNLVFYIDHQSFLEFNSNDSMYYDKNAKKMILMPFLDSMVWMYENYPLDDWGYVVYVSTIYRIFTDSNIAVNVINIFLLLWSANYLYKISNLFLTREISSFIVGAVSCSSIYIYYASGGLKELLLSFVIIMIFYNYTKIASIGGVNRYLMNILQLLLWCFILIFLRPLLLVFILLSFILGNLSRNNVNYKFSLYVILVTLFFLYFYNDISYWISYYYRNGGYVTFSKLSGIGSYMFTYLTAIFGIIGPLPSLVFLSNENILFVSSGLLFKSLIFIYFIIGSSFIIKNNIPLAKPMLWFVLIESVSLIMILESFELRLSMPHIALIYLISGFGMHVHAKKSRNSNMNLYVNLSFVMIALSTIIWSFR